MHLMQHNVWLQSSYSEDKDARVKRLYGHEMIQQELNYSMRRTVKIKKLVIEFLMKNVMFAYLLIGPMKCNGCPLRRVNQNYLLATSTSVDVSGVKVPEHVNDEYFRTAPKKANNKEGDIFESKKEEYKPSEQRKTDQQTVDKQVIEAIKKHPEGKMLRAYLRHTFGLDKGQYPHNMSF